MKEPEITAKPIAFEKVNFRQEGSEKKSYLVKKASKQSSRKILNFVATSFFSSLALTTANRRQRIRTRVDISFAEHIVVIVNLFFILRK